MLTFLQTYSKNHLYSQNGEEGILLECAKRIGIDNGQCVEIGGNDGKYCSNTALFIEQMSWSGTFVETDFELWQRCKETWDHNPKVKSICSHVDKYNINAFVKDSCDILSLDTDGSDYNLFTGLKSKPKIVVVEIDSSHLPHEERVNEDGGVGYKTMVQLGLGKGYFLLVHTGNLIFIDNKYKDLFPEIEGDPLENSELYFNRGWVN